MRIGCCASIDKASLIKNAGFDYVECSVTSLDPLGDEEVFKNKILPQYLESPLPVEAFNVFLPQDIKIVGEEADWNKIQNYVKNAFSRIKQAGAETVVFGSGGARKIPDGFQKEQGEKQILKFLQIAAEEAEATDITLVIEPLNKKESNMINTVSEAVEWAQKVNRPGIQVLADFYHMDEEDEALDHLVAAKSYLKHVHVADTGRKAPGTGCYPYRDFSDYLKQAGYDGRISIECRWEDFETELLHAREFLADIFQG